MKQDEMDGLSALVARAKQAGTGKGAPPVELWEPDFCGESDMRIARDGTWYYKGSPIGREALVRLFASVLRKDEDGKTYLVTPVEKLGIEIDDVPFVAVDLETSAGGGVLSLRTNVGDVVRVDAEHPLRFEVENENGGVKPYVLVRGRLEALLARPLLYELVALGHVETVDGIKMFGVTSSSLFFPIMPAGALDLG